MEQEPCPDDAAPPSGLEDGDEEAIKEPAFELDAACTVIILHLHYTHMKANVLCHMHTETQAPGLIVSDTLLHIHT